MSSQPRSLLLVNPFTLLHYYFNTVLKFLPSLFGVAFLFLLDQFSNVPLSPCIPFFLISFHTQQILIASPKNIEIDSGADRTTPLSPIVRQELSRQTDVRTKETRTVLEGTHTLFVGGEIRIRKKRVSFFFVPYPAFSLAFFSFFFLFAFFFL